MKILVKIFIPAIAAKYDMWLPVFIPVSELVPLIIQAITELSNGEYTASGEEMLCLEQPAVLLKSGRTLQQYRVRNGDCLVLI